MTIMREDSSNGAALARRLSARIDAPLTRFAPAPTGFLHIGHVVNAVFVWGLARALGGRVLLRIEDHDRQRCRREYEEALLEDLDWLGFQPDIYPTAAFRAGPCEGRQRDRDPVYRAVLGPLIAAGLVYGCDCSRATITGIGGRKSEVGRRREPWNLGTQEPRYAGRCRDRGLPLGDGIGWRVPMSPGAEHVDDAIRGPLVQDPSEQCGDLLVRDRLGNWTYQWAVTADDTLQGITLIIRGEDLLASTGRQIRLARLLGRDGPPQFAHHALVMKSPTQKVSKSDRDTGVRDLRAAGWSAAQVIGQAAHLAGLQSQPAPREAAAVADLFEVAETDK